MVKTQQIQSVESTDSAFPWYELRVINNEPEITVDKDGGQPGSVTGTANVPGFVDLPTPAQRAMSKDVAYAVTESGEFIAYELGTDLSEHDISLRAHLAWYDAAADEFTILEFVEG